MGETKRKLRSRARFASRAVKSPTIPARMAIPTAFWRWPRCVRRPKETRGEPGSFHHHDPGQGTPHRVSLARTAGTTVVFVLIVIVLFSFTFNPTSSESRRFGPGLLWLAFLFAGSLMLQPSFLREQTNDTLAALR